MLPFFTSLLPYRNFSIMVSEACKELLDEGFHTTTGSSPLHLKLETSTVNLPVFCVIYYFTDWLTNF